MEKCESAAHPDRFVEKSVTDAAGFGKTVVYLEQVRMRFVRICCHPPRGGCGLKLLNLVGLVVCRYVTLREEGVG